MKKKIGEIYNIPIVIGDKNLKTKNEIHIDELNNTQSGRGSAMEYLDITNIDTAIKAEVISISYMLKYNLGVYPVAYLLAMGGSISQLAPVVTAVAIYPEARIETEGLSGTIGDLFARALGDVPRITEEEFYNLNNGGNSMIEFTINGTPYQAEEGMTWREFVESSYNEGEFSLTTNYVAHNSQYLQYPVEGGTYDSSRPTDVIVAGTNYSYMEL
jgi:hypothetical protein